MKLNDYSRNLARLVQVVILGVFCVSCSGLVTEDGSSGPTDPDDGNDDKTETLTLSALPVNGQTLSVTATRQSLTGILPFTTESIDVVATPTDAASAVTVVGNTDLANTAGKIAISIIVMAQDGLSSKTYTVDVIKEGAALEYPSGMIVVSSFKVGGTCYGDMPMHVFVSFDGMSAIEAAVNPGTQTWTADIDATSVPNGPKKRLTVDTVWDKGTLHLTKDYTYTVLSACGHSMGGFARFLHTRSF